MTDGGFKFQTYFSEVNIISLVCRMRSDETIKTLKLSAVIKMAPTFTSCNIKVTIEVDQ